MPLQLVSCAVTLGNLNQPGHGFTLANLDQPGHGSMVAPAGNGTISGRRGSSVAAGASVRP